MTPGRRAARLLSRTALLVALAAAASGTPAGAAGGSDDPWDAPFAADTAAIRQAADKIPPPDGADSEVLFKETSYVLDASGRCTIRDRTVVRLLTAAGVEGWEEIERAWAPWHQDRPVLRARVLTSDGKVHELDSKTIAEGPAGDESLELYSDRRIVRAPLPALASGAILEREIVVRDREAAFEAGTTHSISLAGNAPLRRVRISIDAPASLSLNVAVRGIPEKDVRRSENAGTVQIRYEGGPFPSFEGWEIGMPDDAPVWSSLSFSTGASWQRVAQRYEEVVDAKIAAGNAEALPKEAGEDLTRPGPALSRFVSRLQRRVRYTGIEFGESAIVPATPAETWKRGYGDCKDKASLLVALLRKAGVSAHVALLDAGSGQDVNPALPGLGAFNHAIVVIDGKEPVWIDATDEYGTPGYPPQGVQGRLALIAAASSRELVRIAPARAEDNGVVQTREFFLAEKGQARLVETTAPRGAEERDYRSLYHRTQRKNLEKQAEAYAASTFLAKKIGKLDYSDALDFSRPFEVRLEIPQSGRGVSDENEAVVALMPSEWAADFPAPIHGAREEDEEDDARPARRKQDFVWRRPYVNEWKYRIVPPDGYVLAGVPESGTKPLGTASLVQEYRTEKDGSVTATIRVESGKTRLTPRELEETRAAVARLAAQEAIFVRYESLGARQLATGQIKEALTEYRRLAALHPKEALHRSQIARALLQAGLGEAAKRQADLAVETEKGSALAQRTRGWVLQHDALGRRFGKGFDREGAAAAYRKSIELEPDNEEGRANLAILLEHDKFGERYADPAQVREAVTVYQALRKDLKNKRYDTNLLIALLRAGQPAEARRLASEIAPGAERNQVLLAAIAQLDGADAALAEANRSSLDTEPRRAAIEAAGRQLYLLRSYPAAARLLAESARGAEKPGMLLTQAETLRRIRKFEEVPSSPEDPASVVRGLLEALFLRNRPGAPSVASFFAEESRKALGTREEEILSAVRTARVRKTGGVPPEVLLDTALPALTPTSEGSEEVGYRVTLGGPADVGSRAFYVKREGKDYRIVSSEDAPDYTGLEALSRASAGDLPAARRWLDWAREEIRAGGGDDPLSGPILPRFWTKGSTAGLPRIRLAAASLLCFSPELAARGMAILDEPASSQEKDVSEGDLELARCLCAGTQKNRERQLQHARRLLQLYPDSERAFFLAQGALVHAADLDEAERLVQERLKRLPDDVAASRFRGAIQMRREDYKGVEATYLALIARGKATPVEYNDLAWNSLFTEGASEKAIEYALKSVGNGTPRNSAALHTLATLYAEMGKSVQARDALLESLDVRGRDEPDSHDWYVLGRIAEGYGEIETARADYRRVTLPEDTPLGGSTYLLAKRRLEKLPKT